MTGSDTGGDPILFYFDFSSPFAYLAAHKINDVAKLYGREVDWRPTLLGAVFKMNGNKPLMDQPLKGAYARRDLDRCARMFGVPMQFPDSFPFLSVAAARAVWWLKSKDEALAQKVALALFNAAFQEKKAINSAEAVIEIAAANGVDPEELKAALNDPAVKEKLKTEVDASIEAGVCGAPYFIVDGEPFWGADRIDHIERWLSTGGW
ncbi:2-hydroxychromene-2-carboxylate isomerase [Nisaea acidiphila]|uniref:2-hydroxychromene-2-carboxylate isomerase n=1 Tax=Nisaea acidiphila TaxID=1862145 RepID=A0A9J7AU76_9PROT|nr:2-hydroxychromene-2-carboxylate isomerase [Nisaea acidiphila]UUX50904.1 2-hydroxychromene-2-carboxylate isomerase [Nisaea acidiphila]